MNCIIYFQMKDKIRILVLRTSRRLEQTGHWHDGSNAKPKNLVSNAKEFESLKWHQEDKREEGVANQVGKHCSLFLNDQFVN